MRRLTAIAALLLVAIVGCKDQAPKPPTVTGRWTGSTSTSISMNLLLSQTEATVSGNGQVSAGTESSAAMVSGTYVAPTLSITVETQDFESFNFTGTHSGNSITGTLNGSGFQNRALTLTRQ